MTAGNTEHSFRLRQATSDDSRPLAQEASRRVRQHGGHSWMRGNLDGLDTEAEERGVPDSPIFARALECNDPESTVPPTRSSPRCRACPTQSGGVRHA